MKNRNDILILVTVAILFLFIGSIIGMTCERIEQDKYYVSHKEIDILMDQTKEFNFDVKDNYSLIIMWDLTEKQYVYNFETSTEYWQYSTLGLLRHNSSDVSKDLFTWVDVKCDTLEAKVFGLFLPSDNYEHFLVRKVI